MNNLITIKNLSISFKNNKNVVDDISIKIPAGKTVALVGESGSGKSLTALSILKLLPSSALYESGEIIFKDKNILLDNEKEIQKIRGKRISTIFQEPMNSLNPLHTINKQIEEILLIHQKITKLEAQEKTIKLLEEVGLESLAKRTKIYPFELSGGQRQRVMIAMSIANNPDLLIADEPTTALDVTVQIQILNLLLKIQKNIGMSILFISHDLSVVKKMSDYIYVMKDGKIVEEGFNSIIFSQPSHPYTKELISFENQRNEIKKLSDKSVLEVNNLNVWYPIKKGLLKKTVDHVKAINNFNFSLKEKETIGIVGESGSGKTSLVLAILNLINFSGGISILGEDISSIKKSKLLKLRKKIQIVFQDPFSSLSPRMTIEEIVLEGLNVHHSELNLKEKKEKVEKILNDVDLNYKKIYNRFPHEFSGGQRQRIAIARALILNPKIIILDEPTSALDVTIQNQIIKLLKNLQNKYSLSYIFISHDMKVIRSVSDRIIVIKKGKIVETDKAEKIFQSPTSNYTKNLISSLI